MHLYFDDSDKVSSVSLSRYGAITWFLQSVDYIGVIVICINVILILILKLYTDWIDEIFLAISVTTSTSFVAQASYVSYLYSELENQMKLIKNTIAYTELESEGDLLTDKDPKDWPNNGEINFDNVSMKYKGADRPTLNKMSFSIQSHQKIGIKGRTGAGKSSIISTLYRMYDTFNGKIEIDGINIQEIGLHYLRRNISYIPQTPFLMSTTIVENLNPFDTYSEDEMKQALKDVHLWEYVNSLKDGINTEITQGSMIFSAGQKQLVCLARAILERNQLLTFDEATANIDFETDNIIQKVIREKFKDCTVITIAHR